MKKSRKILLLGIVQTAVAALCVFALIYIYWHEGRAAWLLGIALVTCVLVANMVILFHFLRSEKQLRRIWEQSAGRRQEIRRWPERCDFILACVEEQNNADLAKEENSGKNPRFEDEITALQSQMNPHFLYNTLDSIRGQAMSLGAREIADMTEALSAFFRYSISQKGAIVTLKDEIRNVDAYMQIQSFRFESRIQLCKEMDLQSDPQELYVPKMILQPVVENCIVHGLEGKEGPGLVTMRITQTERRLLIEISDDGIGMDNERLDRLNRSVRGEMPESPSSGRSSGIALRNINRRIHLHFGEQYGLRVHSVLGAGTQIVLTLPLVDIHNVQPEYLKLIH